MTPKFVRDPSNQGQFVLSNVRLAYAQDLNAARVQQSAQAAPGQAPGKPKFGVTVLIPESATDVLQQIYVAMQEIAQQTFGQQAAAIWQELQAGNKLALKNGALKASSPGFAGHWFMSLAAKEEQPPTLLSKFNDPTTGRPQVLKRPQTVLYSGCYANVQVALWAQNNGYGKRINADVKVVQFAGDGEAFGGGGAAPNLDMFGGEDGAPAFGGQPAQAPAFTPAQAPTMGAFPGPAFGAPQAAQMPGFGAPQAPQAGGFPAFAAPGAAPSMGAFAPGGFQL